MDFFKQCRNTFDKMLKGLREQAKYPDLTDEIPDKIHVPCTTSGEVEDEVILEFPDDGDKQLYVSKSFLCYISPVFKAMFARASMFKEQEENKISMKAKKYEDVLEFLLHFHPRTRKPITSENVFILVPLLDEYMNENSLQLCKKKLQNMVTTCSKNPNDEQSVEKILKILHLSLDFSYKNIKDFIVKQLSSLATESWEEHSYRGFMACYIFDLTKKQGQTNECKRLYQTLPDSVKIELLEQRFIRKRKDAFFRLIAK